MNISAISGIKPFQNTGVKYNTAFYPVHNSIPQTPVHVLKPVCAQNLASLFNISFKGTSDLKLDDFSKQLEIKIKEMLEPKDKKIAAEAFSSAYIDKIGAQFEKDRIGGIFDTGISAGSMLNYLSEKKQIKLKGPYTAFIIDDLSIGFLKNKMQNLSIFEKRRFLKDISKSEMKYYTLENDETKSKRLIEEFLSLAGKTIKAKRIEKPADIKPDNYPDARTIKAVIKAFAEYKFKRFPEERNKLIDAVCRYLDENFKAFSYASLEEKLKEQYENIERYVLSRGKTMQDVIYAIPVKGKSYDIVNYLYAKANKIPSDKFKYLNEIKTGHTDGKIYAVLDDICASGESAMSDISDLKAIADNLIIAPLVSFDTGKYAAEKELKSCKYINSAFLPLIQMRDLGRASFFRGIDYTGRMFEEYINEFKNVTPDDAEFMIDCIKGGCAGTHGFVCFPYMIPDNSSEINAFLGSYFLNNDNLKANKAAAGDTEINLSRIRKTQYDFVKEKVNNIINQS